jgi:tRNA (cmo5U34)-methyltransferase
VRSRADAAATHQDGSWHAGSVDGTWHDSAKAQEYLDRVGRLPARQHGEAELAEVLPPAVERVLDLGCGDGRLLGVVLEARPDVSEAVGLDDSPPMLHAARSRFGSDRRVTIAAHDLDVRLPDLGRFDVVVSGFAIHHVAHERKRTVFADVVDALEPSGVFANLEVVRCATPELQAEFERRIGKPGGDPEDQLATVEDQLAWMRAAGLTQVDCYWRWRGFALLVGRAPS